VADGNETFFGDMQYSIQQCAQLVINNRDICDIRPIYFDLSKAIIREAMYKGMQIQNILSKMRMRIVKMQYYQLKLLKIFKIQISLQMYCIS